ncbi:GSCOCG00009996001-RA-CDS [Cotesia congregata]|nr:GSCOCG00009996001-RA-CDS [Cotesia congregata]
MSNINYLNKQEAIKAGEDLENALKVVNNIFKGFKENYITVLEIYEELKVKVEKLEEKCTCKKNVNLPERSFVSDFTIESDSPGIVENTQLESRSKIKFKTFDKKKTTCFKVKSPVKIPKSPGKKPKSPKKNVKENRVPELIINRTVSQKSQSRVGQLGISKADAEITLTPSGKVSRQSKLVLSQPKRKILLTNPQESSSKSTFEIPFSQDAVPDSLLKGKNFNPFNNKLTPKTDKRKSESEKSPKLARKLSQSEIATCITQDLNATEANESDFFSLDNNVSFESQNLDSIVDLMPDETFCETGEAMKNSYKEADSKVRNKMDGSNSVKRKFEAIAGPSGVKNSKLTNEELKELEVVNISDWDTDTSSDKWPSTPLKKKNPVNSFDRLPEKKKSPSEKPFIGEVIRNKGERAKLRGWDCSDCEKYYNNLGLTEKEKEQRKNLCSRHRSKFNYRYFTPPGFWDPVFPDTVDSSQEN